MLKVLPDLNSDIVEFKFNENLGFGVDSRAYDNLTIGAVTEVIINFNDLLDSCKGTLTIP